MFNKIQNKDLGLVESFGASEFEFIFAKAFHGPHCCYQIHRNKQLPIVCVWQILAQVFWNLPKKTDKTTDIWSQHIDFVEEIFIFLVSILILDVCFSAIKFQNKMKNFSLHQKRVTDSRTKECTEKRDDRVCWFFYLRQ